MSARSIAEASYARARASQLPLAEKVRLLTGQDYWSARGSEDLALRPMIMSDGPAGVRGTKWDERDAALLLPCATALASTWDHHLVERLGSLLGTEAVRKGVQVLLAPTINMQRSPYAGRHFEYLSEDPVLTGLLSARLVAGIQSHGVAATLKHFVCNDSETERFTVDVRCSERTLREIYLLPFEIAISEANPWAVMASYNGLNGTTMSESPLLNEVLKGEWGYDGVVVSDWHAARSLAAAAAGLDLVMPGPVGPWGQDLLEAAIGGSVSTDAIDDKVDRLLLLALRTESIGAHRPRRSSTADERRAARKLLRTAAESALVLAKNDSGLLPLAQSKTRRLAVIGYSAEHPRLAGGGSATVFPESVTSPLEALRRISGGQCEVTHAPGPRVEDRVPVLDAGHTDNADGDRPGLQVEFLDEAGRVVWSERRSGGFLTWRTLPEAVDPSQIHLVRVTGSIIARQSGEQIAGCSGTGHFRLKVGGEETVEATLSTPPGTDPTAAYMRPPQLTTRVDALPGDRIPISVEYEPPRSTDTSFVLGGISLQVNFSDPYAPDHEAIAEAEALAAAADAVVLLLGTTEEVESEGFDRRTLLLPGAQDDLARRVLAANPRTVVVVNSGAPVLLPWVEHAETVLLAPFPGQEFGPALARVVFGEAEPSGRLSTTWPACEDGLPTTRPDSGTLHYSEGTRIGYRRVQDGSELELFPFGHGLGYSTWDYTEMRLDTDPGSGDITATVTVVNRGTREAEEVIQVYAQSSDPTDGLPDLRLVGFAKVWVPAKCSAVTPVFIPRRRLTYWNEAQHRWTSPPGPLQLSCGRSCRDLRISVEVP